MTGIVSAEWLKLRSVRSSYYAAAVLLVAVPVAAVLTWQGVRGWEHLSHAQRAHFQSPPMEQVFLPLVQMCLAVLGALVVTSEYATHTIYPTLVAVPRRLRVLAAKTAIVAATSIVAGMATELAIYFVNRAIVAGRPLPGNTGPLSAELPTLIGLGLSVTITAIMALGLGTAIRSTAATLLTVSALIWVLPIIAHYLPASWARSASAATLTELPKELGRTIAHPVLSAPWAAVIMAAYALVALAIGATSLLRRDA